MGFKNYFMPSAFKGIAKIFPRRIWQQVFVLLALLAVLPLTVLGTLLTRTSQKAIRNSILHHSKEIAVHTTGEVRENIKGAQQALFAVASILGTLHADPWRQETAVVELALQYPMFQRIASVDLRGKEIVVSQLGTSLQDRSGEEAFIRAKAGEPYISEVRMAEDHVPVLTMAAPVRQLGKIRGVLAAEVNLRGIWDIVDSIRFGRTGTAYLVDRRGRIIAHPDKKRVLQDAHFIPTAVIEDIRAGHIGYTERVDAQGKPRLISYAPVELLNWGLIIEQSAGEAYAFSRTMKIQSWILICLSILATVAVSLALSRWMSYPVRRLIQGTERLAKGDFTQPFRIRRRDEIGRLLFSFNRVISKLRKAQEKEKLSVIGKAAAAIAHELKNSLVLVNTFIRLLPERHKDKKFVSEFSQTIPKELDSWNAVLRNMMEFSRLNHLSMVDLDVNALVKEAAALVKWRARQKNIGFDVRLREKLPSVAGNADKLKQVFLNLAINSLEATPAGGAIVMETALAPSSNGRVPEHVEVKVTNTGEGISREDMGKIFDPFYTTKASGLGLGLSISKEIVEYHGGHIEVLSERGGETTFTVRIPAGMSLRPAEQQTRF